MRPDFLALPYIDEQSVQIGVTRAKVWISLVSVLRTDLGHASPALNRLLQLAPGKRSGDWHDTPNVGDTLPGFEVADALVPMRLALRGGHRFSTYALVFVRRLLRRAARRA